MQLISSKVSLKGDGIEAQVMMIFESQQRLAAVNFGQPWDCPAGISSLCAHPKAFCCASPIWWHSAGQEANTSGATESTRLRSELTMPPGSWSQEMSHDLSEYLHSRQNSDKQKRHQNVLPRICRPCLQGSFSKSRNA